MSDRDGRIAAQLRAHHGDLVIALAAACFASEHLVPCFVGVGQLENYR